MTGCRCRTVSISHSIRSVKHTDIYYCLVFPPSTLLESDPKNYLTYYKRATIYLAMGKFKSALPDLSKAIELKPDFMAVSRVCVCLLPLPT